MLTRRQIQQQVCEISSEHTHSHLQKIASYLTHTHTRTHAHSTNLICWYICRQFRSSLNQWPGPPWTPLYTSKCCSLSEPAAIQTHKQTNKQADTQTDKTNNNVFKTLLREIIFFITFWGFCLLSSISSIQGDMTLWEKMNGSRRWKFDQLKYFGKSSRLLLKFLSRGGVLPGSEGVNVGSSRLSPSQFRSRTSHSPRPSNPACHTMTLKIVTSLKIDSPVKNGVFCEDPTSSG